MSGIAGIHDSGRMDLVGAMLDRMAHRGPNSRLVFSTAHSTLGIASTARDASALEPFRATGAVEDGSGGCHSASARAANGLLELQRDAIGLAPLYYGHAADGRLCFASEVKGLLAATQDVHELPPGATLRDAQLSVPDPLPARQVWLDEPPETTAVRLRDALERAVRARITGDASASWLSGGLDSSAIAALARPGLRSFHTFAGGLKDSPDLRYASQMAEYLGATHVEVVAEPEDLMAALPEVIFHLESFDPYLVRSSVMHYLVARKAADYADQVFSGEGADELFGGYAYLKEMSLSELPAELLKITGALHNTALQRVDRCSAAFGLVAHIPFLDPEVVALAWRVPPALKIKDGVEKWILRLAMQGRLPEPVLNRGKAKFWEGAGVQDIIAGRAERTVSDDDFRRHKRLENGYTLRTKEEHYYYRIFRDRFGDLPSLSWLGVTAMG